jgi:Domain of unknown function (DUF5600)
MKKYNLSPGDFPDIDAFQIKLADQDFTKFHHSRQKLIDDVESVLSQDFPRLMEALPRLDLTQSSTYQVTTGVANGGASYPSNAPGWHNGSDDNSSAANPFGGESEAWSLQV